MNLRAEPVEETATLPDGHEVLVRVAIANDGYIPRREQHTVALELLVDDQVQATVNTVLDPAQVREARALAREVASKLTSGELEPTAHDIEPLADSIL